MTDADVAQPTPDQPPPLTPEIYKNLIQQKQYQPRSENIIGEGTHLLSQGLGRLMAGPQQNPFAQIISRLGLSSARQPAQPPATAPVGTAPVTPPADPAAPKDVRLDPEHPDQPAQPQPEQRYLHSTRHPSSEWGKTPWAIRAAKNNPDISKTSHMPSHGAEAVTVVSGASRQLATWGFPQTQPYWGFVGWAANVIRPFMDFYSGGAFGRAYDANTAKGLAFQREAMEINHQRMLDAGQYAIAQDNQILSQYRELVAEWQSHAFSKDDNENTRIAEARMKNLAQGDKLLQNAIDNGGLKGGMNIVQQRHQQLVDGWLAINSMESAPSRSRTGKTAKEDSELASELGETGTGMEGLPGPALAGEQQTTAAAPLGDQEGDENENVMDDELMQRHQLKPAGMEGAHTLLNTGKFQGMSPKDRAWSSLGRPGQQMAGAANDMQMAIDHELRSKDDEATKEAKIKSIDDEYGSKLKGLADYELNPKDHKGLIDKVTQLTGGQYDQLKYDNAKEFLKPGGVFQRQMTRSKAFATAELTLLDAVNKRDVPEDASRVFIRIDELGKTQVIGDPRYPDIKAAIEQYINEYANILSGQGIGRVQVINHLRDNFNGNMSNAQIRGVMQTHARGANAFLDQLQAQYTDASGRSGKPPGWNQRAYDIEQGIVRMKAETGVIPDDPDIPNELKALGRKQPTKEQQPPWMTPKQAAAPLTSAERTKWEKWLQDHPRSENPDVWDAVNQSLGINR